jgi:hypothetical protein
VLKDYPKEYPMSGAAAIVATDGSSPRSVSRNGYDPFDF